MSHSPTFRSSVLFICAAFSGAQLLAAPVLETNVERPLHYRPDGVGFVVENGKEFFNRPLYGYNTAFRVDTGDKPELSLYLPGRGGNLRLAIKTPAAAKWLHDAEKITTRYSDGAMRYEIRDPLLGHGILKLTVVAAHTTEGVLVRVEPVGVPGTPELVCAFGGANGARGSRDGDIGAEKEPVSRFFQLKPEYCTDNKFDVTPTGFLLHSKAGELAGTLPAGSRVAVADAEKWNALDALLAPSSGSPQKPIVIGRTPLRGTQPLYFALQRLPQSSAKTEDVKTPDYNVTAIADKPDAGTSYLARAFKPDELPRVFADDEKYWALLSRQITVETPDAFINAAVPALCIAADGVWDTHAKAFDHGAVAWRRPLLGWRGAYSGDELGWHDRTRAHLANWFPKQNTEPVADSIPAPEKTANLSRNETALHSNGDLSKSHYDMNLPAIDVFFRHLLWTGDLEYARAQWPVIERHLAWERRLFRREVGPDKLPLYEAYCCIWASDDLYYSGGGATHSSAYNVYHNRMAARVAKLLGKDASLYEREAELIAKGMRQQLWLADRGWFAESKDLLGLQRTHDSPALWTFYHTVDSEVPTPLEGWQMSRFIDTQIAHIPIKGEGVPDENLFTLPTTNWMPYTWSTNNVVMGEVAHTALAFWQIGREDEAFRLFKGCVLDSMFMGLCPGNVGMATQFDMARNESQRDFSDGVGMTSRALIEGLFGVKPDALAGELTISPGFPRAWDHAQVRHPDFAFGFQREGMTETYSVESKFPQPMRLKLKVPMLRDQVATVTVNNQSAAWKTVADAVGLPVIEIAAAATPKSKVVITWSGEIPKRANEPAIVAAAAAPSENAVPTDWNTAAPAGTQWTALELTPFFNDSVSQIFKHEYLAPRSPFCSLAIPKQGFGSWCHPLDTFEVDDAGLRAVAEKNNGRLVLPNGVPFQTPGAGGAKNIAFVSQWENFPREIDVPLKGKSARVYLLMAGSTNSMQSRIDNGEVIVTYADGTTARLPLRNPENWWPIDQDYLIDDFAFRRPGPLPPRVNLKTGEVRILEMAAFKGKGRKVEGGAATVLDLPLDPAKELKSLTVRALSNDVVIGLMSATLARQ